MHFVYICHFLSGTYSKNVQQFAVRKKKNNIQVIIIIIML